ncbi:hypothetical protein NHX12_023985 [Muraenolepis orangiensis]|uniref:Uncharacterized protein n=1 Tax=Muraenolepis orangiensis TaxID=630683 RepID=A0A9Q0ELR5_9TELE|nr:hypothetical protein NHX12_023985 [Muraenolepis orangiensis]
MHTRKRHSELYHELNHSSKCHTIDRYSRDPAAVPAFKNVRRIPAIREFIKKISSPSSSAAEAKLPAFANPQNDQQSTPDDQQSWDSFKTMTPELRIVPGEQKARMELHNKTWDSANTPDSSGEGDFQTEV